MYLDLVSFFHLQHFISVINCLFHPFAVMSSENNKDKEVSLPTPVVAVPLSMVPPANLPVPQQLGNNRSLYLKGIMQ